jgi:hypothetical protein
MYSPDGEGPIKRTCVFTDAVGQLRTARGERRKAATGKLGYYYYDDEDKCTRVLSEMKIGRTEKIPTEARGIVMVRILPWSETKIIIYNSCVNKPLRW